MTAARPRVVVLDDYQSVALTSANWSAVTAGHDIDVVTTHLTGAALLERVQDATVVVAMRERTPFPAEVFTALSALRLLVTTGPRNAAIDLDAARRCGVTVCGTRGGAATSVPELAFGMMIALARNLVAEDTRLRSGGWQHTVGVGLAGRTLGLVGLGGLGQAMVPLARALGMDVIAWSPHLTSERARAAEVRAVSKADLFATADFVSVHLVLSESTRHLIGPADLDRMPQTSYLVNTSRGAIVDEVALLDALREGRIAGAALDVFDVEPLPPDSPWRDAPRTLLSPHLGYVTVEGYRRYFTDVVEAIVAFDAGRPVRVLVPPVPDGPAGQ